MNTLINKGKYVVVFYICITLLMHCDFFKIMFYLTLSAKDTWHSLGNREILACIVQTVRFCMCSHKLTNWQKVWSKLTSAPLTGVFSV